MLLLIDNYDSFTFNLFQYFSELGAKVKVVRNDEWTVEQIAKARPKQIVLSPGPGHPRDAGVLEAAIRRFAATIPMLGVCLGHQAMGDVFGGTVKRAPRLMHGKTSPIHHTNVGVFKGLTNPFEATRYHSLVVDAATIPTCLEVTATTADGLIMGLRHREFPCQGVQFHPESILTTQGKQLLKNFLEAR